MDRKIQILIEEELGEGFYIFGFNDKEENEFDYLQDTLEIAKRFVERRFDLIDQWQLKECESALNPGTKTKAWCAVGIRKQQVS